MLARAWSTPGQSLHHDPALLRQIERAIRFVPTFYGPPRKEEGNWWFWTIGPALDFGPTLLLVGTAIDPVVLKDATEVLKARIGPWPGVTANYSVLGGQNLVWSSMNHLMYAVLTNDQSRIDQVRDRIASVCSRTPGRDGLQADLSFHQHGPQLYTGGYGGSFAFEVSRYILFTSGTSFALPEAASRTFGDFIAESLRWTLFGNHFDISSLGREAVRPSVSGFNGLAALLHLSAASQPRSADISRTAVAVLQHVKHTLPPELSALAQRIAATTPEWPSGNRYFSSSDYVVHRRAGWFASVKMFSVRTKSGERTNGENLLGSRQSDGRLQLLMDGGDYLDGEALPLLDWSRLPGITVEQSNQAASDLYGYSPESFVGGVSDGTNGVAAMRAAPLGTSLTARKGWIFFDDCITSFVNSAQALSGNRVETVVDQRPVRAIESLTVDGVHAATASTVANARWASADRVGYWFPESASLRLTEEARSGNWKTLAVTNPDRAVSGTVRTMVIDHGMNVANGNAVYGIVPGVTAEEMKRWEAARHISILSNDSLISAARDNRTALTGIIFWAAGSFDGVSVDRPSVLMKGVEAKRVTLAVSDPTQAPGTMKITMQGRWRLVSSDRTVTLESTSRATTFLVSRDGRTTLFTIEPIAEVRRRGGRS